MSSNPHQSSTHAEEAAAQDPNATGPTYTISPALLASPHALPPAAYLALNPHITNLLASAAVFTHTNPPRLLLVQRAPTDFMPLKWELPGGSVDASDASMVAGAVRELSEETGLRAASVLRWVGDREFAEGVGGKRWRQGIFKIGVDGVGGLDGPEVRLDPAEHVRYLWVTVGDLRADRCGEVVLDYADPEWKVLLLRAFEVHAGGED